MSETSDNLRPKRRRWGPSEGSQTGQVVLEYTLLLATFGIPMIYLSKLLLEVLAGHYEMVTFLETLPLP
jgi:hypothetical protein